MLNLLFSDTLQFLLSVIALVVAVTIHEFAHAFSADRLGDPTPRVQGRLNLNPLSHLDPIGTLMLLLAGFGWGKPVQFDPYNLEHPRRDAALISFAGPLSNLILATAVALILRFLVAVNIQPQLVTQLLPPLIFLNIVLAIFNLIPIHPLDGGKILVGLLPAREARDWDRFLHQYGLYILILLILPIWGGGNLIGRVISPIIDWVYHLLISNINTY